MSPLDFSRLRQGNPGCPSDLVLDGLAAGELSGEAAKGAETHVASCAGCKARLEKKRAGWDAVPEIDPRASLARLRTKLDRPRGAMEKLGARWRRLWLALTPLAVAGAVTLFVLLRPPSPHKLPSGVDGEDSGAVRFKGGPRLRVHRMIGNGSEEIESGTPVHARDRLRFVVDLPSEGYLRIVGVEASGRLYPAWPEGDGSGERRPAGAAQLLPGAMEVDENAERETLYLVACPLDVGPPRCSARGAEAQPDCPKGCALARFVLNKAH